MSVHTNNNITSTHTILEISQTQFHAMLLSVTLCYLVLLVLTGETQSQGNPRDEEKDGH